MHLFVNECLFIPLWYIFNDVNKQAARIIHTTAKNAAMVVAEMAQAAKNNSSHGMQDACKHTIIK